VSGEPKFFIFSAEKGKIISQAKKKWYYRDMKGMKTGVQL